LSVIEQRAEEQRSSAQAFSEISDDDIEAFFELSDEPRES
jgi:hypothetical protein